VNGVYVESVLCVSAETGDWGTGGVGIKFKFMKYGKGSTGWKREKTRWIAHRMTQENQSIINAFFSTTHDLILQYNMFRIFYK
jgi:hypothetical protein